MAGMTPEQQAAYDEIKGLSDYRLELQREQSLKDEVMEMLREFIPSNNLPRAVEIAVGYQAERIIELVRDHDKEED